MNLFRSIAALREAAPAATSLTIGVFDGVHRGHQALIAAAVARGRELNIPALALTFANHPLTILAPPYAPPMLSGPEEKAALLAEHGIGLCLMLDFDAALAATPAEAFLEEVVAGVCRARFIVCGRDFRFGAEGGGNVASLGDRAAGLGIELKVLDDWMLAGAPVRSSRVRAHLLEGDIAAANLLLGRRYALAGPVVEGEQRGRTIGYPTANVAPHPRRLVPANGVYAATTQRAGEPPRAAMVNIGVRPTFEGKGRAIEAHILDFAGDLYGAELAIQFVARIRDEQRFPSADALVEQLRRDESNCRAALASCR